MKMEHRNSGFRKRRIISLALIVLTGSKDYLEKHASIRRVRIKLK